MAGLGRVPKGLGFGTRHMCVLREAGQRCQRIGGPDSLWVTLPLWPPRVKVGGTCAGLGFSSAGYGLHFFILWAWAMSWETLLSIF